jgi:RNA polymerase sigma-70 factor (ECF subfamily)
MDYSKGVARPTWVETSVAADPDLPLIRSMASGDARALDELYARHGPGLLAYLTFRLDDRALAEEVLQDVMLAAWRAAPAFRAESRVRTWLLAIARNRANNACQRRPAPNLPLGSRTQSNDQDIEGAVELAGQYDELRSALRRLPEDQRETLALVFTGGLTGAEAAEVLKVAPGTVKSRLSRARAALRALLRTKEDLDDVT